jgi:hypothetical protein
VAKVCFFFVLFFVFFFCKLIVLLQSFYYFWDLGEGYYLQFEFFLDACYILCWVGVYVVFNMLESFENKEK